LAATAGGTRSRICSPPSRKSWAPSAPSTSGCAPTRPTSSRCSRRGPRPRASRRGRRSRACAARSGWTESRVGRGRGFLLGARRGLRRRDQAWVAVRDQLVDEHVAPPDLGPALPQGGLREDHGALVIPADRDRGEGLLVLVAG